ncbi:hypothetical protein MalM25_29280 [Planctomycetes bacterium MalM25]|nr:hypothetical protein MalM25_29280 [Planctomycetes bacterium MalM25]
MESLTLPNDFKEFFELLNSENVEYLLVGGFAVALHGYVRATSDIDAWVRATPENSARIAAALKKFGFSEKTVDDSMFAQPRKVFQIGVEPYRIDVLTRVSGLDFDSAYARRLPTNLDGVNVPLISLDDLKANKLASGRNKDLADLDYLP